MIKGIVFDSKIQSTVEPEQTVKTVQSKSISRIKSIFTPPIIELIENYQKTVAPKRRETATIHVDEIASKIARFYEQIRKIVDWKEENVLRRSAILRILKRSLISKVSPLMTAFSTDIDYLAESLILELIRGGHLPNDEMPIEKIEVTARVLEKYIYILEKVPSFENKNEFLIKKKINFYNWLLEIAACEIEDVLAPPDKENALIKAMTLLMSERIQVVNKEQLSEVDKRTLTYIAVCRTLFDLDDSYITFHMIKYQYPDWLNPSREILKKFTLNIFNIAQRIEKYLKHPLSRNFFNICENTDTVFTILGDILDYFKKNPAKIFETLANKNYLRQLTIHFYNRRYKTLKIRLFRLAIFSTLSVFVSNWFTYFIVEVPLANLFYEGFNFWATAVDFILPSLAMLILVVIIKPPAAENLNKVIQATFNFIYQNQEKEIYQIKTKKRIRFFFNLIIGILYLTAGCFFFGVIAWVFYFANIPKTSVVLDTIMIAVNVFAALVIRNKARELTIQEKPSFFEFALDVLSVPVARVGNFLANKWKEYNIISIFFNYFIEMPFVTFIEFIESWRQFLKDEKAEIH